MNESQNSTLIITNDDKTPKKIFKKNFHQIKRL